MAYTVDTVRYARVPRPEARTEGRTERRKLPSKLVEVVFFFLFLCAVIGATYMLGHFMGLDNLAELHGADRMVAAMSLGPAPQI